MQIIRHIMYILCSQDHMAVAGVSLASVSGRRQRAALQRHSDQPLLGADVCVLLQQVNPSLNSKSLPECSRHHSPWHMFFSPSPPLLCRFGSDPSSYVVRIGASEQTVTPQQVVVHRKFKGQSGGHDVALLKLPSTKGHCLTFEADTNAACLPAADPGSDGKIPSSCVALVTTRWTGPGLCLHLCCFNIKLFTQPVQKYVKGTTSRF